MTACRLPGSFLDVLPNVRSPTPTQSKVHTGAGEIQDNISCMDYTTSEFLLFPRLTKSWLLPIQRLVAAWTACTVQKKKHGGSREHDRASHVLHAWSAAWPAGKELKSNQHTHMLSTTLTQKKPTTITHVYRIVLRYGGFNRKADFGPPD